MTKQARNMATGGVILAAIILALWLMKRKTPVVGVRLTTRATGQTIQGTPGPKPGDPLFVGPVLGPGDTGFVGPVAAPGAGVPTTQSAGGWDVGATVYD